MSFLADLTAGLAELRTHAEARMTDRCTVTTGDSAPVWNEETLEYNEGADTYSYSGRCLIKAGATQPRTVDAAGQALTQSVAEAHFPMDGSEEIRVNHVIVMQSSLTDAALPGRKFRITGPAGGTYLTARRFPIEETN